MEITIWTLSNQLVCIHTKNYRNIIHIQKCNFAVSRPHSGSMNHVAIVTNVFIYVANADTENVFQYQLCNICIPECFFFFLLLLFFLFFLVSSFCKCISETSRYMNYICISVSPCHASKPCVTVYLYAGILSPVSLSLSLPLCAQL